MGAHGGTKAKLQASLPWLFWSWCFAHRVELSCKDAVIGPLFQELSEMLLRLYYFSKKSQELTYIVYDLKEVNAAFMWWSVLGGYSLPSSFLVCKANLVSQDVLGISYPSQ